jgi:hypothetical protein
MGQKGPIGRSVGCWLAEVGPPELNVTKPAFSAPNYCPFISLTNHLLH